LLLIVKYQAREDAMSKRETALPLTMSVPQFARLVFDIGLNSAYAAADRGDIANRSAERGRAPVVKNRNAANHAATFSSLSTKSRVTASRSAASSPATWRRAILTGTRRLPPILIVGMNAAQKRRDARG
jgi:hypothetical protein